MKEAKIQSLGRRELAAEIRRSWAFIPVQGVNRKARRARGLPAHAFSGQVATPLRRDVIVASLKQYRRRGVEVPIGVALDAVRKAGEAAGDSGASVLRALKRIFGGG